MVYAYVVENSLKGIHIENQELFEAILDNEIDEKHVYTDAVDSIERLELMRLKAILKKDDVLLLRSIGDLTLSARDLLRALAYLDANRITIVPLREPDYLFSKYYRILQAYLTVEDEWKNVKRIRGILKAKNEGRMGRKTDRTKVLNAIRLYNTRSFSIQEIRTMTGVSPSTLYRALKNIANE